VGAPARGPGGAAGGGAVLGDGVGGQEILPMSLTLRGLSAQAC